MFNQLLPRVIDNSNHGPRIALWLFGLVALAKSAMSVNLIFNGYVVATTADGVPLDTYPLAAARTIVALFAIWGLAHLLLSLICFLVLVRYRSIVPFMFLLLVVEHLSRKLILQFVPVIRAGHPPAFAFNLALLSLMILGLGLSLWSPAGSNSRRVAVH
ncbi:MAG: hypothetical protein ABI718_17570 [Acidobacteriota bacterium]